jgi:integrase
MTKRSHGAGSVGRRGENSWRLRYHVSDTRHAVTFRGTKKEAEAELRRLLGDADRGAHIAPGKLTLKQWADQWIELKAAERQHKTVARYEDLLRLHVLPKLGDRPLQQLKHHEINLLYAQMTSLAPRTRHHVATVLKSCLQAAMDSKLIASNPAGGKRPSPGDAEVGQALDQDQIAALVEGFRGSTLFEIVCVLAFTGMRRGEASPCVGPISTSQTNLSRSIARSNTHKNMDCSSRRRKAHADGAPSPWTISWSAFYRTSGRNISAWSPAPPTLPM